MRIKFPHIVVMAVGALIWWFLFVVLAWPTPAKAAVNGPKRANIASDRAIKAIVGEAEGEPYEGMVAIGCAIRNRGSLIGVYGANSKRVKKHDYGYNIEHIATNAWEESAEPGACEMIDGATGWGNKKDLEQFKKKAWWKKMKITKKIGHHYFYKQVIK